MNDINIVDEDIIVLTIPELCKKYKVTKQQLDILFQYTKNCTYREYKDKLLIERRKDLPKSIRQSVIYDIIRPKLEFYGAWDNNSKFLKLTEIEENLRRRVVIIKREIGIIDSFIENTIKPIKDKLNETSSH